MASYNTKPCGESNFFFGFLFALLARRLGV
jgi:hypothetical protein